jgi:hypothetical protein
MTFLITSTISGLKRSNDQTAAQQMMEIKRIKSIETPSFKKKSDISLIKLLWKLLRTLNAI